jgi:solute carrier family 25 (mitochondrial carrier protein), member 16
MKLTIFFKLSQFLTGIFGPNSHASKFLAGSGAGVTAVSLTYPLDTIRARLAFQITGEHVYTGIVHTATCIFKEVGKYLIFLHGLLKHLHLGENHCSNLL